MRAAPLLLARLSAGGESCGPGSLKWAVATGGPIYSSAAVSKDGGTVYVGSVDQKLHALTAARGVMDGCARGCQRGCRRCPQEKKARRRAALRRFSVPRNAVPGMMGAA